MSVTDALQLNKTELFAKIRAGLTRAPLAERQQTQNLVECIDDLLFVWDVEDACLLVLNWRLAQLNNGQQLKHQTLIPSLPQSFQVERLLASNEGSLIALAGPRGVSIVELPRRWGKNGQFMDGKDKITCRSYNLDAHFFGNNLHLELRQLRWHPSSPTDSHLLVLLSDNTIRVYDNAHLRHVWRVGPLPHMGETKNNSFAAMKSTILALGETAVDFDFAPPVKVDEAMNCTLVKHGEEDKSANTTKTSDNTQVSTKPKDKIEWPLVILRENGNIYILMISLDTERPRLQGPLTITPQAVDNYGLESCAILLIPSLPPTVVIAEANGKLHHALLLEAENAEDSFSEVDSSLAIHPSQWTVHVLETVELELGLPKQESTKLEYMCPIYLKRDFINELRYFAYHNAGLHVVSLNFIDELQRYLESDVTSEINVSTPSRAEYIVCTKVDESKERINAVLGFVLLQLPSGVVLLLGSGQVVSLKLVIDAKLLLEPIPNKTLGDQEQDNPRQNSMKSELDQLQELSFVDHVKNLLKRSVTQPILSLDKASAPNTQECFELLTQAIEVLRTQYLKRHELVRAEFTKRINTIRLRKQQQQRELEYLEQQREKIREQAHKLADRYEEICDQQEMITKRCQDLMRLANTRLPSNPLAEKEFIQEVERINSGYKNLYNTLQKAKESISKQAYHIAKHNESNKQKAFELPEKQKTTIQEILTQMTSEIDGQIREIKRISKIVGI